MDFKSEAIEAQKDLDLGADKLLAREDAVLDSFNTQLIKLAQLIGSYRRKIDQLQSELYDLQRDYKGYHEAYWNLSDKLENLVLIRKGPDDPNTKIRKYVEGPKVHNILGISALLAFRNNNSLIEQDGDKDGE